MNRGSLTGIINGFERVIDVGTPIVKDLTQDISLMIALRTLISNTSIRFGRDYS